MSLHGKPETEKQKCICGAEATCFDLSFPYCNEHELVAKKMIWEGLGLEWKP
jgi:hypothetical protein